MNLTLEELESRIEQAAEMLRNADALLIGAGAGMGVDSGLPDFRGNEGFWKAYPPFRGRIFSEISNPNWFRRDPELAWGFFGHRLNLYRDAVPHVGFSILKRWMSRLPMGGFVFTSNVDGQFQKAGFDSLQLMECHGSIHRLQCVDQCEESVWSNEDLRIEVDHESMRAQSPLPRCPRCGGLARPNILMFGDGEWVSTPTEVQREHLTEWRQAVGIGRIVAIECGAGLAIPSVRSACEQLSHDLVRINPRDFQTPPGGIGIPLGAVEALQRIDALLSPN